uniref:Uncharacterized protein n=1 Tax=Arundo donax TaxID=35708 RepID=A0A0A9FK10_ARUDO
MDKTPNYVLIHKPLIRVLQKDTTVFGCNLFTSIRLCFLNEAVGQDPNRMPSIMQEKLCHLCLISKQESREEKEIITLSWSTQN